MTTIVYDHKNKQVAIDSRISSNGIIHSDSYDKTIRKGEEIWLITGCLSDYEDLALLQHNQKVDVRPSCSAILIRDNKAFSVVVEDDNYCSMLELKYNYAMGSGDLFAMSALDFGSTALEAIEYAKTRDIYTGGNITVIDVDNRDV